MSLYVSHYPEHCLIDFSKLILKAHDSKHINHLYVRQFSAPYYKLGKKEEQVINSNVLMHPLSASGSFYYYKKALTLHHLLDLFSYNANKAVLSSDKVTKALTLLRENVTQKYYSGFSGKLRKILYNIFGWKHSSFIEIQNKIDNISKKILKLPQKSKIDLKKKKVDPSLGNFSARKVFTDCLDLNAIGALGDFSYKKYSVEWMSPRDYLNLVDPHFKRHFDEESIPWISEQMQKLIQGTGTDVKFSPLMMDPRRKDHSKYLNEDYHILPHEGRHRALVAERLGIEEIPVAIPI